MQFTKTAFSGLKSSRVFFCVIYNILSFLSAKLLIVEADKGVINLAAVVKGANHAAHPGIAYKLLANLRNSGENLAVRGYKEAR